MKRAREQTYVGIDDDYFGGMTPTGTVIRDAYVFGFLPESESCKGWSYARLEALYDKVAEAWQAYGHSVARLPDPLRERHERIFGAAIARAKSMGWSAELGDDD